MDPLTLFALANGAVSAVKAGCKLYKDIKGAAGEVKDVLKDLDEQFKKLHPPDKPPTSEQKNQYIKEKNRVLELNKRSEETTGIYTEIGEHLGTYYDNLHKCLAIFEEEERRSRTEIYKGDSSLGKRALQRVLMRKQLQQMGTELQELMIYQSPKELGALWTDVNAMMQVMGQQQKILVISEMQKKAIQDKMREARIQRLRQQALIGVSIMVIILTFGFTMLYVAHDRQLKYPQYGDGVFPTNPNKKQEIYTYTGR